VIRFWFTLSLLVAKTFFSVAQNDKDLGRYPLVNFHHRQYNGHSQSWSIVQDSRGMIYVANNVGVIEFDGAEWRHIDINDALARCLGVDANGRVWVGGQDEFGYLAADSSSSLTYHSLVNLLPEFHRKPGLIRQIYPTRNGVFFSTFQALYKLNTNLSVSVWQPKNQFHRSYYVDDILFINERDYGLSFLRNDSLVRVPGCEIFGTKLVYTILPYNQQYLLIGTQSNGFYLLNKQALEGKPLPPDFEPLKPFTTSNDSFFTENRVYSGVRVDSNLWAIGTYSGGVALLDAQGNIARIINKEIGLQDNTAWYLYLDNAKNIWMALNNGISYSPYQSQLTSWTDQNGISGVVQSAVNFKGTLYYSSNTGVYRKSNSHFEKVIGINDLSWKLLVYKNETGKQTLLAATSSGIYQIDGNQAALIPNCTHHSYSFVQSKLYPGIIYTCLRDGIGIIQELNGNFKGLGYLLKTEEEIYSLVEDSEGDIWFTLRYKGIGFIDVVNPFQLNYQVYKKYIPPYNPKCDDISVNLIEGKIYAATENGLSSYCKTNDSFIPDSLLGTQFADGSTSLRIFIYDHNGNIWFEAYRFPANRWLERASRQPNGRFLRKPAQFNLIPETIFFDVSTDDQNNTWIASTDGLYRFNASKNLNIDIIPRTYIRQITGKKKQLIFGGCPFDSTALIPFATRAISTTSLPIKLSYNNNSLTFTFSSPYYEPNLKMLYSFKLEGYDDDWSEWSTLRIKEYTNLRPGMYRFMVKSKNIFETESPVEIIKFYIDYPFYLKWYSFIAYAVLLTLVIWGIVRFNTKILRISNIKLQELVDERTKELKDSERALTEKNIILQQQKEEILSQRDELEERNQHINDSIQYAKTIQQAILPDLNSIFPNDFEYFLIYLPKEMVSGDFYWVAQVGPKAKPNDKIFVAVVDCTGHGVPGAFMSLIGSRLLSEIVQERKNHNPAAILTELNQEVNRALRQDISDSFDGMDIGLCLIERKSENSYVVTYAGANRPLYYYQKDDTNIQAIKGNRKSIGSVLPDVEQEFTNWKISMQPGGMLILSTDGITDQNNSLRKKFTSCRLHNSLKATMGLPLYKMQENLLNEFLKFKGDEPQRDDITVLGIRL